METNSYNISERNFKEIVAAALQNFRSTLLQFDTEHGDPPDTQFVETALWKLLGVLSQHVWGLDNPHLLFSVHVSSDGDYRYKMDVDARDALGEHILEMMEQLGAKLQ